MKSLHVKQDGLRTKLCALQDSLDAMKGRLHDEKSKRCKVMFDEELKRKWLENEIQDLNDWIFELEEERKVAKKNEKVVREKYYNAVIDAQYHHHRWHQECDKRRDAETRWLSKINMLRSKTGCMLICWRTSMKSQQIPSVQCRKSGMTRRQLGIMVEGDNGPHG